MKVKFLFLLTQLIKINFNYFNIIIRYLRVCLTFKKNGIIVSYYNQTQNGITVSLGAYIV